MCCFPVWLWNCFPNQENGIIHLTPRIEVQSRESYWAVVLYKMGEFASEPFGRIP